MTSQLGFDIANQTIANQTIANQTIAFDTLMHEIATRVNAEQALAVSSSSPETLELANNNVNTDQQKGQDITQTSGYMASVISAMQQMTPNS